MIEVPSELEKYLTKDEVVERSFNLKNCKVWATNKRLFVKIGKRVQDVDYNHISSVGFEEKRYYKLIVLGVILFIIAGLFAKLKAPMQSIAMICLIGIVSIILGIILRKEWLELVVLGFSEPIKFEGSRQELDRLLKIIREKRF